MQRIFHSVWIGSGSVFINFLQQEYFLLCEALFKNCIQFRSKIIWGIGIS